MQNHYGANMSTCFRVALIGFFLACSCKGFPKTEVPHEPLTSSEVLALVAGDSLPESIVQDIRLRGLAFKPSKSFRELLAEAGADAKVLEAYDKAAPGATADSTPPELLKHLAKAGQLMRSRDYDGAASELTGALQSGGDTAAAFEMGAALTAKAQYEMAARVYAEILDRNPNFPEAHTKLSFVLHKCDNCRNDENRGESLRQAKAALADSPDNAEAHKNAGLALFESAQYDAALAELNEALRIKPDYVNARLDVGLCLSLKGDHDGAIAEYRKALVLDPNNVDTRYYLGRCKLPVQKTRRLKNLGRR
jgi:tetratricopeptide (TPR) repeat protein